MKSYLALTITLLFPAFTNAQEALFDPETKELHLETLKKWDNMLAAERREEVAFFLPSQMSPVQQGQSANQVANQVLTHTLDNIADSMNLNDISNYEIADRSPASSQGEEASSSAVDMKVRTQSASAQVEYNGFARARLIYRALSQSLSVEISKELDRNASLVFTHSENTFEVAQRLGLRWSW